MNMNRNNKPNLFYRIAGLLVILYAFVVVAPRNEGIVSVGRRVWSFFDKTPTNIKSEFNPYSDGGDHLPPKSGSELETKSVIPWTLDPNRTHPKFANPDLPTTLMIFAAEVFPKVKNPDGSSASLSCAVKDAALAREFLSSADANTYELSPNVPLRATREHFLSYAKTIADKTPENSRFAMYVSTHGAIDKNGQFYFLTEDSEVQYGEDGTVEKISNAISGTEFAAVLASIKSKEVVVFSDACFCGGDSGTQYFNRLFEKEKDRAFYALFSSSNEPSQVRMDVHVSVFTYYLSLAFYFGDANRDGYVSTDEIYDFLKDRVALFSYAQSEEAFLRISYDRAKAGLDFEGGSSASLKDLYYRPFSQEPTRVVGLKGAAPKFKAPRLNVAYGFEKLAAAINDTIILKGCYKHSARVDEFLDGKKLANNPIGKLFANELEKRLEKSVDISERPTVKSVKIRPTVPIMNVSDEKGAEVSISGFYLDFPTIGEIQLNCLLRSPENLLASFMIYLDRKDVESYLIGSTSEDDQSEIAPPAEVGLPDDGSSQPDVASSEKTSSKARADDSQTDVPKPDTTSSQSDDLGIAPPAEAVKPFQNPSNAPLEISIRKKSKGEGKFTTIYSSDSTQGEFYVSKGDVIQIGAKNLTDRRLAAIPLVDGLNILAQANDEARDRLAVPIEHLKHCRYWVLRSNASLDWNGWQQYSKTQSENSTRDAEGYEFLIADPPESLAYRVDATENVGEIRILIYETEEAGKTGRGEVGVGTGAEFSSKIVESKYRAVSGDPMAVVVLKYCEK